MKGLLQGVVMLVLMVLFVSLATSATAAELDVGATDSLTTGTLEVSNSGFAVFHAPAGTLKVRSVDDNTTETVNLAFVKLFAVSSIPESSDADADAPGTTGVPLVEGDVLTFRLSGARYVAIDGARGTSLISAWYDAPD